MSKPIVAIVDYGMGNLFSVQLACAQAGLTAVITASAAEISRASAVILPGVGAFGDAIATLTRLDLISVLRDAITSGRPFMGICLGFQLLLTTSEEFGDHPGLDIIRGKVVRFSRPHDETGCGLKVPHVGWNAVYAAGSQAMATTPWGGTPLSSLQNGGQQYFVHSYCVVPDEPGWILSLSRYGDVEFCSSVRRGSVFACQFHPERSGPSGLNIYREWAKGVGYGSNT